MTPNIEDLTREKSLWGVLLAAKNIGATIWQYAFYMVALSGTGAYVLLTESEVPAMAISFRSIMGLTFNSMVALLGFLLAGFTFFASFGDKSLFLHAARYPHDKFKEMSWLKYFMFSFVKTLGLYFLFVFLSFLSILVCGPNGPLSEILSHLPDTHEPWARRVVVSAGYLIFIPWSILLIAALASFIYNVYHVTMLSIQWEWEAQNRNQQNKTSTIPEEKSLESRENRP